MLDTAQILFWTATYLLIVIDSFRDKKLRMPLTAGMLNFVWELNALVYSPHWGHVLWLTLNVIILWFNLRYIAKKSGNTYMYLYVLGMVAAVAGLYAIFRIPGDDGMLISAFTIDAIMAVDYLLSFKRIDTRGKIAIAVTKLLGDLFALLAYCKESVFVVVAGILVLILNLFYLSACLEERADIHRRKRSPNKIRRERH